MLNEPNDREHEAGHGEDASPESAANASSSKLTSFLERHLTKRWLIILLTISILGHGVGFAAYVMLARRQVVCSPTTEIDLGRYCFVPEPSEGNSVVTAEFDVHVVPLEEVDAVARRLLVQHQNRVRGDVEELLRRAHGGDFRDPALIDLKRQLQEQVNEALGIRAVAEVIVTNLTVERPDRPLPSTPSTAADTAATTADAMKPAG